MKRPFVVQSGSGMLLAAAISQILHAATPLPVPCAPGGCGSNANSFVSKGAATAVQSGNSLKINQTSNDATLNWASFNIGANGKVTFAQPNAGSIALNRIYDANPSSILGSLNANGQIYLINANGFLFGSTARVNTAGMIASSLNISDSTFASGILAPVLSDGAALQPFTDANGSAITNTGSITVQQGAQLTATNGGRLLLAAPTVQNAGTLTANDGQVVLAAGQTVYLQASSDPSLRGLIVQVDGGGNVANQLTGSLNSARGNITLTGLMVNQDGRVSATTTVSANGSVRLEAADGVKFNGTNPITATQGGTLELGSSISIMPEYADSATAVDAQTQLQSSVSLVGEQVLIHGASIVAPSGSLTVGAEADPDAGVLSGGNSDARLRIDAGTNIDLAGSVAELPMSANLVTVQLRSNELADDPSQRNGALRGQTVTVDVRADGGAGTPIANVSSAIAAVGKNIAQRTEAGGTVSLESEGDIVFNPGASINVSGGHTTYLGGNIQTTALVGANGSLVDIGSASPLQTYSGVVNPTFTQAYDKWGVQDVVPTPMLSHYDATYQQGAAAGSVQFAAPAMILQGSLSATVVNGPYQRGAVGTFGGAVPGGTLTIGLPQGAGGNQTVLPDYLAPAIAVINRPIPVMVADGAALPAQSLQLPAAMLVNDGFTNMRIFSNTTVAVPSGLSLNLPGGSLLQVSAARVDVDSSITDLGGTLNFASILTIADQNPNAPSLGAGQPRTGVSVGPDVTLDVSGRWTNDSIASGAVKSGRTLQNGGSVTLQSSTPGSELVLGDDVTIRADGGAWLQSSGSLAYGTGGAITLDASPSQSEVQFGQNLSIEAFGVETASGGRFSLTAPRIDIGQGTGAWTEAQLTDDAANSAPALHLFAPLFSSFGFSSVSLTATGAAQTNQGDVLTLLGNTHLTPLTESLLLNSNFEAAADGGTLGRLSHVGAEPVNLRPSTSVAFNVERLADDVLLGTSAYGTLDIQSGASITSDPGSKISLTGEGSLVVSGTLRAPGGGISLETLSPTLFNAATASSLDPGYDPNLGITLGSSAVLDVSSGGALYAPNGQGLLLGSVMTGGSVSIVAQRGFVSAAHGSSVDVAGGSGLLDVATPGQSIGYSRETVASAGGSLTVSSVESISFLSTINAKAGSGNSGTAAGGSLEFDLTRNEVIPGQPDPFGLPMELDIVGGDGTGAASRVNYGTVGVSQIENSGADALTLRTGGITADGSIAIDTAQPLTLGRELVLDARSVSVSGGLSAALSAPLVEIGNSQIEGESSQAPAPSGGSGALTVNAEQLVLFGNFAVQGVANTVMTSQGDIQLQGVATGTGPELGSLITAGNLTLNAARVYPDTYSAFTLQTLGSGSLGLGNITIGQSSASPGAPLSAGGAVSVVADDITVNGTLLAPFGQLLLSAGDKLTLGNNSLVSVSGAGLSVPYGQTQDGGREWIYQTPNGVNSITAVPQKAVSLTAPNIVVKPTATVDLQGGGGLYAYEWVPGTGGSKDQLSQTIANASGYYAILPSQKGLAAPFDPQDSSLSGIGQTVYFAGGAGIAPGFYALLPARYALEPGALLIQVQPSYTSANGGQIGALGNGAPVIAGYLSVGTTGLHTGTTEYEGFAVYPGSYAQQLAAYLVSDASTFFSAAAATSGTTPVPVTANAGSLTFNVVQSLNNSFTLQGSVLTDAATGGAGALVNVSAPSLEITGNNAAGQQGAIAIAGSVLQSWNASELVLGGSLAAGGSNVSVSAGNVTVDGGVNLTADQILLVAQQTIDVKSGAVLSSTSGKSGTPLVVAPVLQQLTLTSGGAPASSSALLAVSDLALPVVARSGVTSGGSIDLESGSQIRSGGAISIDAPLITANGAVSGKGASWSLSSDSIAFAGSTPTSDSFNINTTLLSSMQQAAAVRIESQSSVDIATALNLGATANGGKALSSLTILGESINNRSGGNVTLGATTLTLGGADSGSSGPTAGSGTLSLVSNNLQLVQNSLNIDGFAHVVTQVPGSISMMGSGALNVGGDLTLNATQIAPGPGSTYAVTSNGAITIGTPVASAAGGTLTSPVGGALSLTGTSILDDGAIVARSGLVTLNATNGDLDLGSKASIDTSGAQLSVGSQTAATPGGSVSLQASGAVSLASGSRVSVSGIQSAPAGTLAIVAGATASLGGGINGAAGASSAGGNFILDAGQLAGGLTPLANVLTQSGFSQQIDVRVRSGALDLAQGATLTANQVALTADAGVLSIEGTINAPSAGERGHIELSSGTSVSVGATGQLHADASGAVGQGGEIEINSTCAACTITLAGGSLITAHGGGGNGQLVLRAPALIASNDVAINVGSQGLGADVSKVGQIILEPVITVTTTGATVDADLANGVSTASGFLTNAASGISARLAPSNASASVQAGLELQDANAQDSLTIHSFDLSSYSGPVDYGSSQAPQVINLSVRAAGSISVSGTISDGFIDDYNSGLVALSYLQTGPTSYGPAPSASIRFVAGADLTSANPNAVLRGAAADLTLLTSAQKADGTTDGIGPSVIRTGTGDLNLFAARDVVFQTGTAAYTGGTTPADVIQPLDIPGQHGDVLINFGTQGGSIRIGAGRDVIGAPADPSTDNGNSAASAWLVRQGDGQHAAQYGVDFATFDWNVGALEGGDVAVSAGRNIINLSAATADSLVGGGDTYDGATFTLGTGGGLSLRAGGDVGSAQIYVADGSGTINAGGGLTTTQTAAANGLPVGSGIALGNSEISVYARTDVQVDAIYNPTFISQGENSTRDLRGQYFTYGDNSSVSLSSTAGAVTLEINTQNATMSTLVGQTPVADNAPAFQVLPASLSLQAPQGNLNLNLTGGASASAVLFPSATGQLSMVAGNDINATGGFTLSDNPSGSFPTVTLPGVILSFASNAVAGLSQFDGNVHVGDSAPVIVSAGEDINNLYLSAPKFAQVTAGRDIVNLQYYGQNNAATDTTLISAGRDLINLAGSGNGAGIQVGGPGSLDVLAGRNLDLGFSNGITTVGNIANANLASPQGADINVMVGYGAQGADIDGFLQKVVANNS
ncbi:MAG TPA: filamentous hemagglutinin N-terminal domain-containing protein, partial [Steroidobacteraceae bacterium]